MSEENFVNEIVKRTDKLGKTLLYLIYSNNREPIKGRTMVQKEMFLVAKFIPEVWELAEFIPYNHGAYSEDVKVLMDEFKSYEILREDKWGIYLTDFGEKAIRKIVESLSIEEKEAIDEFKLFMNKMTLNEVLVYSYFSYKFFAKDSAIIPRVLSNRLKASISLYKRGVINLEKAIFLSGLSGKEFLRLLKEG